MDLILHDVRQQCPAVIIERLTVTHPGDDDNVYFIGLGEQLDLVQLDTASHGAPPFLVETEERRDTSDPDEATAIITTWLRAQSHAS